MSCAIRAENLDKWRHGNQVLSGINVDVQPGEVLWCTGRNGAGKSTLLAILAGMLQPEAGRVWLFDRDLAQLGPRAYRHLGVALQPHGLSPRLTIREVISFFARCYRVKLPLQAHLERFGLEAIQHRQVRRLSLGQQQRVSLSLAFIKPFDVVLLDEPMTGLDAEGRAAIQREIDLARERGAAVVCATHGLADRQRPGDRTLELQHGRPVKTINGRIRV